MKEPKYATAIDNGECKRLHRRKVSGQLVLQFGNDALRTEVHARVTDEP